MELTLCIILLLKLYSITDKEAYRQHAEEALRAFSVRANDTGIYSGYFFSSLDSYFNTLKLSVNALADSILAEKARTLAAPYTHFVYGKDDGNIVPCIGNTCYEPITDPEELEGFLKRHGYNIVINN